MELTHLLEGRCFPVRRAFSTPEQDYYDPFLLFDHLGPTEWDPHEAISAPDHLYPGFNTVTYC